MAVTVDFHIREGSSLRIGAQDDRNDAAEVTAMVKGLTNAADMLNTAVTEVLSAWKTNVQSGDGPPYYHNAITTLDLADIDTTYHGNGMVEVRMAFSRGQLNNPTADPFDICTFDFGGFDKRKVVTDFWYVDSTNTVQHNTSITYEHEYNVVLGDAIGSTWGVTSGEDDALVNRILVPAGLVSDANLGTVKTLEGKVNSDVITIKGVSRAIGTVRFMGPRVIPRNGLNGIENPTFYQFEECTLGFAEYEEWEQHEGTSSGSNTLSITFHQHTPFGSAAFSDAFPVWNPTTKTIGSGP